MVGPAVAVDVDTLPVVVDNRTVPVVVLANVFVVDVDVRSVDVVVKVVKDATVVAVIDVALDSAAVWPSKRAVRKVQAAKNRVARQLRNSLLLTPCLLMKAASAATAMEEGHQAARPHS